MSKQSQEQTVNNNKRDPGKVKQKRKNAHQVRKYFRPTGETKQICTFCGWETRENATRMVQHIVQRCNEASEAARDEISASLMDAEEREMQSFYTSHNKKAVHEFFKSVDDDRKRQCVFCRWTTVLNLTRMRYHILQMCNYVPPEIRQSFMKQEHTDSDSQCDTYCIVNVNDGDRKGLKLVSSNSLEHTDTALVQEVVLEAEVFDNQEDVYYDGNEVEEMEETPGQLEEEDNLEILNQIDNETEIEIVDGENASEDETLATITKSVVTRLAKVPDRYYTINKRNGRERLSQLADEQNCIKKIKMEKQDVQNDNKLARTATVKVLHSLNQQNRRVQHQVRKFRTGLSASSTPIIKQAFEKSKLLKKKEANTGQSSPRGRNHQESLQTNDEQDESPPSPPQKTAASVRTVSQPKDAIAATSTSLRNTPRQESDAAGPEEQGSCHSFGGGHVYPQEAPRFVDHKLQYTKAVISRPAPEFEATAVVEGAFKKIKLSDYRGKYLVFFFYPLDFTFVCPTEILAFSDRVNEFKKLNTEVIAASIDSHFTHLAWINTPRKEGGLGRINIPLVSDITHSISKDYGVFLDDLGHTLRGLFIIDDRGVLRQITMNDLPVGRSVDETLRLVQAFQYTDKHGEVCPAGWKPGQDTIVPNPEAKIKYFEKNH
ncbi:uncharacterized protein LOC126561817 isoform X2 [Anopheles maculipalpis]|uniref:uncharacterized protein LOC126561817 isoform X2 n=1 Tax=Anopheles maculipalpis TaxID=1496333 RepID=UPI0021599AAC|nr:uncharacterized protein LOC126561817 isoform X2 [Anopheles maculipalpis]